MSSASRAISDGGGKAAMKLATSGTSLTAAYEASRVVREHKSRSQTDLVNDSSKPLNVRFSSSEANIDVISHVAPVISALSATSSNIVESVRP
jgi:hypothetical protein